MKTTFVLILLSIFSFQSFSQSIYSPQDAEIPENFDNIYKEDIYSDDLVSSFLIVIRKEVGLHKHSKHSEHVYVLEGTGEMRLGEEHVSVTAGDFIIIPKDTPHSLEVTSRDPMKIISVQAPLYDGSDKVKLE